MQPIAQLASSREKRFELVVSRTPIEPADCALHIAECCGARYAQIAHPHPPEVNREKAEDKEGEREVVVPPVAVALEMALQGRSHPSPSVPFAGPR